MLRRPLGRDVGLSLRIVWVLALLAATVGALAAGFVFAYREMPSLRRYWVGVAVVLTIGSVHRIRAAERSLLATAEASTVERSEAPALHALVDRLGAIADVSPPKIAVSRPDVPTAFAVGLTRGRSVLTVAGGLHESLDDREFEAVVAHELSHIVNHDAAVMTIANVPRTLGSLLLGREEDDMLFYLWFFLWPFGALLWGISSLLTASLSRYRDLAADRFAALLTGAPEEVMSALQKLAGDVERVPAVDLREIETLNDFLIVRVPGRFTAPGRERARLEHRLARLGDLAREMGKASAHGIR